MKKNKGFTLIELLAVLVILGILVSFSTVAIGKIKKKQDAQNELNAISSILTGAKAYNAEKRIKDKIKVSDLLEADYVDYDQSKYPSFKNVEVTKETCSVNILKIEYIFDKEYINSEGKKFKYTDCGCLAQQTGVSSKLCEKDS